MKIALIHRLNVAVTTATLLSVSLLSGIPAAHAANLVPQKEGEIKLTNLSCLGSPVPCLDTTSLGYTVTSKHFDSQFNFSRLFVDSTATTNDYSNLFGIKFLANDEGTNPSLGEYWLRPVAYTAPVTKTESPKVSTSKKTGISAPVAATVGTVTTKTPSQTTSIGTDGTKIITDVMVETTTVTKQIMVPQKVQQGNKTVTLQVPKLVQDITTTTTTKKTTITSPKPVEQGRLEVGRFQFDFAKALSGIRLSFFDTEDSNHTGLLSYTNSHGNTYSLNELLSGGKQGNIQTLLLKDVKSFEVQLGNPGKKYGYKDSHFSSTGDGVDLQLESVPEPGNTFALGTLALVGIFGWRQRRSKSI